MYAAQVAWLLRVVEETIKPPIAPVSCRWPEPF
jgi:hypothetical protein